MYVAKYVNKQLLGVCSIIWYVNKQLLGVWAWYVNKQLLGVWAWYDMYM